MPHAEKPAVHELNRAPAEECRPDANRDDTATVARRRFEFDARLLYDAGSLAIALGVSRAMVSKLRASGRLPDPVRLGRRVLWARAEVEAWIKAGCPGRDRWDAMRRADR